MKYKIVVELAASLERQMNELADDGWRLAAVMPPTIVNGREARTVIMSKPTRHSTRSASCGYL